MIDWTWLDPNPDPVGDLREYHAQIFIGRALTPFERIIVRGGLGQFSSNGTLWPVQDGWKRPT